MSVCFLMLTSPLSTDSYFALIILNIFEPRLETIHTNTHTDRFVAWRRLACLNASSSHLCNNMLVTLTLKYANTHTCKHTHFWKCKLTLRHTLTHSPNSYTNTQALLDFSILSSWALALQALHCQPKDHTHHANTYTCVRTFPPLFFTHTNDTHTKGFSRSLRCPAEVC